MYKKSKVKSKHKRGQYQENTEDFKVLDDNDEVIKRPFKWKRWLIVILILGAIITGIVLGWGYGFGGFQYQTFSDQVEDIYVNSYIKEDTEWYQDVDWIEDDVKNLLDWVVNETITLNNKFSQSYVIEVTQKINNDHYYIGVTDTAYDSDSSNYTNITVPTIFFETEVINNKSMVVWMSNIYDEDPPIIN